MADKLCPSCNKPIIWKYICEGASSVMYMNKEVHLACAMVHIMRASKSDPPETRSFK